MMFKNCMRYGGLLLCCLMLSLLLAFAANSIKGDVTGDGLVTSADANALRDHLLGKQLLQGDSLIRADVNSNNHVDVGDLISLVNMNNDGSAQTQIRVLSPATGSLWLKNQQMDIAWDYQALSSPTVNICLWRKSSVIATIAANAPNTGAFTWTVPSYYRDGEIYRVQVSAGGASGISGNFWVLNDKTSLPDGQQVEWVRIPAGSCQMGSAAGERGRATDESPLHTVSFAHDFLMSKYEVTQGQWQAVMGHLPAAGNGAGGDYPVYNVSWQDVSGDGGFVEKANDIFKYMDTYGSQLRLPSEAEWEYACRAGTATRFSFGDSLGCNDLGEDCFVAPGSSLYRSDYMWFWGNRTQTMNPVGLKLPNPWGLHDMHGNVWEWCQDDWHDSYFGAPADGSAWVASGSNEKVMRGGSCFTNAFAARSAYRYHNSASMRSGNVGFRLVRAYPSESLSSSRVYFEKLNVLNSNASFDAEIDGELRMASDGNGVWVAVWTVARDPLFGLGDDYWTGAINQNEDLYFARSTNNGLSWSMPKFLKPAVLTDDGDDSEPEIITDRQGNWLIAWSSRDSLGGAIGNDADLLVVRSQDNGATWSAPAPLNADAATDRDAVDPNDDPLADPQGECDHLPKLATDRLGRWLAIWSKVDETADENGEKVYIATSSDLGLHWSSPELVAQTDYHFLMHSHDVATNSRGRWLVAWDGFNQPTDASENLFSRYSDNFGTAWSDPVVINTKNPSTDSADERNIKLAADDFDQWMAVWEMRNQQWDIMCARSSANGSGWLSPTPLNNQNGFNCYNPDIKTNDRGVWLVKWTAWNENTIPASGYIHFTYSEDNGQIWEPPAPVSILAQEFQDASPGAQGPLSGFGFGSQGSWIIAWPSTYNAGGSIGGEGDLIYSVYSMTTPTPTQRHP